MTMNIEEIKNLLTEELTLYKDMIQRPEVYEDDKDSLNVSLFVEYILDNLLQNSRTIKQLNLSADYNVLLRFVNDAGYGQRSIKSSVNGIINYLFNLKAKEKKVNLEFKKEFDTFFRTDDQWLAAFLGLSSNVFYGGTFIQDNKVNYRFYPKDNCLIFVNEFNAGGFVPIRPFKMAFEKLSGERKRAWGGKK